ncbi:MAG: ABC transporter permease [Gemmatimonadales bacterium]|nr:ABC transporter permease [Gemmatimonadales bacterium]
MRSILALVRVAMLSAASYRIATVFSFVALLATVVPIYFISGAIQPIVQDSIQLEGGQYFGFLIVGIGATYVLATAVGAVPSAIAGSIGNGTFEALLVTRTPLPVILMGLSGYPLLQSILRATLLLIGAAVIGVQVHWSALPYVLVILVLLIVAYGSIGLVAAALVLVFRTSGPLLTAVIAGSGLLGGVYYSTTVIPAWLQSLSAIVPLTYALRATRVVLLAGGSWSAGLGDVLILSVFAATGVLVGSAVFGLALRHARSAGTLSQY